MAKKTAFKELSEAEFASLSLDLQDVYLKELEANEAKKLAKAAKAEEPEFETMSERAERFFEEVGNVYQKETVFVTSDLFVFTDDLKGENSLLNYLSANSDKSITSKKFTKKS